MNTIFIEQARWMAQTGSCGHSDGCGRCVIVAEHREKDVCSIVGSYELRKKARVKFATEYLKRVEDTGICESIW